MTRITEESVAQNCYEITQNLDALRAKLIRSELKDAAVLAQNLYHRTGHLAAAIELLADRKEV